MINKFYSSPSKKSSILSGLISTEIMRAIAAIDHKRKRGEKTVMKKDERKKKAKKVAGKEFRSSYVCCRTFM